MTPNRLKAISALVGLAFGILKALTGAFHGQLAEVLGTTLGFGLGMWCTGMMLAFCTGEVMALFKVPLVGNRFQVVVIGWTAVAGMACLTVK